MASRDERNGGGTNSGSLNSSPTRNHLQPLRRSAAAPEAPMEENDREYFKRRGKEERQRAMSAATPQAQSLHGRLADMCDERANRSANENSRSRVSKSGRGLVE